MCIYIYIYTYTYVCIYIYIHKHNPCFRVDSNPAGRNYRMSIPASEHP